MLRRTMILRAYALRTLRTEEHLNAPYAPYAPYAPLAPAPQAPEAPRHLGTLFPFLLSAIV
jgi:hypothetical protein